MPITKENTSSSIPLFQRGTLFLLYLSIILFLSTCTGGRTGKTPVKEKSGSDIAVDIQSKLDKSGPTIDYDTLMQVYAQIVESPSEIPGLHQLLRRLIQKRNNNPRVDQMILIFASRAIGDSRFKIPDVFGIFDTILKMDNSRITYWVLSYLGTAIGSYSFDIPNGDLLADMLEKRMKQIDDLPLGSKEYYGCHFLPPPKSPYIHNYISGIKDQRTREIERTCYYSLILNNLTEAEIESRLKILLAGGGDKTEEIVEKPLRYLLENLNNNQYLQ